MSKILFASGKCKDNEISKIKIFSGRSSAFRCSQMQINVFDEKMNPVDIFLSKISSFAGTEMELENLSTSFFSKVRDVSFRCFGNSANQGLVFEFFNPFRYPVTVYISLIGQEVSLNLVGKE